MNVRSIAARSALVLLLLGSAVPWTGASDRADEPQVITVQHVLISFKGRLKDKPVTRTKKEAEALAEEILKRAQAGEDFDALVKEYTDDQYPGLFKVTNTGAPLLPDSVQRRRLVPSFGDVAFKLAVGEVGMTKYHAALSPFGYHVIKRLE